MEAAPILRDAKMYSQRFGIVQREVKGPTPKVVIVVSTKCVCGTLPLSALAVTPGPADLNLALSPSSEGKQMPDGLNFERRKDKVAHLTKLPYSVPPPPHLISCVSYNI